MKLHHWLFALAIICAMMFMGCPNWGNRGNPTSPNENLPPGPVIQNSMGLFQEDSETGEMRNLNSLMPDEDTLYINCDFDGLTDTTNFEWVPLKSEYWVYTQNWHFLLLSTNNPYQAPLENLYIGIFGEYHPLTRIDTDPTGNRYMFRILAQEGGGYDVDNGNPGNPNFRLTFYRETPDSSDYFNGSMLCFNGMPMNKKWPTKILVESGSDHYLNMLDSQSGYTLPLDTLNFAVSYGLNGTPIDTVRLRTQTYGMYNFHLNPDGSLSDAGGNVIIPINPGGP